MQDTNHQRTHISKMSWGERDPSYRKTPGRIWTLPFDHLLGAASRFPPRGLTDYWKTQIFLKNM